MKKSILYRFENIIVLIIDFQKFFHNKNVLFTNSYYYL